MAVGLLGGVADAVGEGSLGDFAGVAYLPPGGRGRGYDAKALPLAVRLPIMVGKVVGINS